MVEDNVAFGADSADGKFRLVNLKFGTYTVREHQAPEGYTAVLSRTETVVPAIDSPDGAISKPGINGREA